mgnify:CR=1 FL=1
MLVPVKPVTFARAFFFTSQMRVAVSLCRQNLKPCTSDPPTESSVEKNRLEEGSMNGYNNQTTPHMFSFAVHVCLDDMFSDTIIFDSFFFLLCFVNDISIYLKL